MSSQQPFTAVPDIGDIQHVELLSEQLGKLCLCDEFSDLELIVESTRFPVHKVVLASRSEYFRALLYGGMRESSQKEIELKDTPINAFKHLLRYIYTGYIRLSSFKEDAILDILGLAHKYGFRELEDAISEYLKVTLAVHNVCLIYDTSSLFRLDSLSEAALVFMDNHAQEILVHDSFLNLSETSVREVISRDSFNEEESEIFRAVARWAKANMNPDGESGNPPVAKESVQSILKEIRLSLLTIQDLLKVVRPTDLMPADILLDAIQAKTECRDTELRYRGFKLPEENVATPRKDAIVLTGEVRSALLDGDSQNYDMERGFSRHPIDETGDKGIVVKLGMRCIINRINLLLWDKDHRAYSYYIEVSVNQEDWVRIIDHSKSLCRSWQFLHFPARVVQYIRIVGTHNTVNKVFHVVSLEAMFTKFPARVDPELGLVQPDWNVATLENSALVIEGVCRKSNALLNGDTSNYDWDSGYTCHQLGSGAIIVQLGQPFALDTMRMLLWDCDDRSYSYYIEVSLNKKEWEVVCDKSRESCRSWQVIRFKRRPVVFIRIVGTHNTANEVFHCVHFECPAMVNLEENAAKGPPSSGDAPHEQQQQNQGAMASDQSTFDEDELDERLGASRNSLNSEESRGQSLSPPAPQPAASNRQASPSNHQYQGLNHSPQQHHYANLQPMQAQPQQQDLLNPPMMNLGAVGGMAALGQPMVQLGVPALPEPLHAQQRAAQMNTPARGRGGSSSSASSGGGPPQGPPPPPPAGGGGGVSGGSGGAVPRSVRPRVFR